MILSITKHPVAFVKSFILLSMMFLFITSCKKQDDATKPLKTKMVGKWAVTKVETTVSGSPTTTVNGGSNDYVDFKSGDDDIVEINVSSSLQSGTYSVAVGDIFFITIGGKLYNCSPTLINDNKFEFTAAEDKSTPSLVRKYFLTR